jgi:addiction module RelE/StbE family toxin
MEYEIIWTETASSHVEEIRNYLAERSSRAPGKVSGMIMARVELLRSQPLLGWVFRCKGHRSIRETVCKKYRIFYRVHKRRKAVEILAVWHGSRQEPNVPD